MAVTLGSLLDTNWIFQTVYRAKSDEPEPSRYSRYPNYIIITSPTFLPYAEELLNTAPIKV